MKVVEKILALILGIIIIALIFAYPTMWLWNYLMPDLFGLAEISVWQGLAMIVLGNLLFKGSSK